jgi:hypothetical protein
MEIMKVKDSSKERRNKATHMRDEAFADLKQALEGAFAFERGERRELRVTRIEGSRPPIASVKIQPSGKR